MKRKLIRVLAIIACLSFGVPNSRAFELWDRAQEAYENDDEETGNRYLAKLIEDNPGNIELATRCLEEIYDHGDRHTVGSRWMRYVADRVAGLERTGAISANTTLFREILGRRMEISLADRRMFATAESHDHLAQRYPHDIYWQIERARAHHALNLPTTRDLFEELKKSSDTDHPDIWIRGCWATITDVLGSDFRELPQQLLPPREGSPLPDLEPDDTDGRWQQVAEQPLSKISGQADRLIGITLMDEGIVPWRDMSGLLNPSLALDLHLRSLTPERLDPLRQTQENSFARQSLPLRVSSSRALALFRRYPWAKSTHTLLLAAANEELFAGHALSALRSFDDLLDHSKDQKILELARTGRWIALSTIGERKTLEAEVAGIAPSTAMRWMNQPTTALELGKRLLERIPARKTADPYRPLSELKIKEVRIPPVSPWLGGGHPGGSAMDMGIINEQLLVSSRNHLAVYPAASPASPTWSQSRPPSANDRNHRNILPGYFRPGIEKNTIYTRWGFGALPQGVAAFDINTGAALWLHDRFDLNKGEPNLTVISDPVNSDGLLYMLLWQTHQGNRIQIACVEIASQTTLWRKTIAEVGTASDLSSTLQKSSPVIRTFGNRLTLKDGAIYVNTNAGLIARCDPRDGTADWIHYYTTDSKPAEGALGCAPIITTDKVICMPRDTGKIFALDRETGRLVWDNYLILGIESLGVFEDTVIIRGQNDLAAIDLNTGKEKWYSPLPGKRTGLHKDIQPDRVLGRAQRNGHSIYIATHDRITEIDARDGKVLSSLQWSPGTARPLSFLVHDESLYVIGAKPATDRGIVINEPLNSEASSETTPLRPDLKRNWILSRNDARIIRAPYDSPLANNAFVLSGGLLECIDISPKGAVKWRLLLDALNPNFHIVGDKILMLSGSNTQRRMLAFNGETGDFLWESAVPGIATTLLQCGEICLLHDRRSLLFAFNPDTGEQRWEQRILSGQLLIPHWDGEKLHVFETSMGTGAQHTVINPLSGRSIRRHEIELGLANGRASNGKLIENGYYEVSFKPVSARFFRLVMLSEVNGRGWSSVAELHVADKDGKNLDRSNWTVHFTDSFEPNTTYDTRPERSIDGNRTTWWHSQWLNGIPPHPHELQFNLGKPATFQSFRYLPAVIVNNNGMIGEYEFYASNDGENWGTPIVAGTMIKRLFIDRAKFTDNALVFESRSRSGKRDVYSYRLDGKQATPLAPNHEFITAAGNYALAKDRTPEKNDTVVVLRTDDPSYRFEIGKGIPFDQNRVLIKGDRLCLASHKVVIADLAKRQFIRPPAKDAQPHDKHGIFVLNGKNEIMKFVHNGNSGAAFSMINLSSGDIQQSLLTSQTNQLRDIATPHFDPIPHFENVLLLRDDFGISAWSSPR
ncbi:MAG: PQQ-binding-like beta-propeller repeat protein [Verrucomicrobiaceae bacterium]|nr:PQQ-binding-like beta-propeller repeat protein [Verrucomicrobiaceae bacterium]